MPYPPGTRFRIRKTKTGYQRLAFKGKKVIEVTEMKKNKQGKLKAVASTKKHLGGK